MTLHIKTESLHTWRQSWYSTLFKHYFCSNNYTDVIGTLFIGLTLQRFQIIIFLNIINISSLEKLEKSLRSRTNSYFIIRDYTNVVYSGI